MPNEKWRQQKMRPAFTLGELVDMFEFIVHQLEGTFIDQGAIEHHCAKLARRIKRAGISSPQIDSWSTLKEESDG